MIGPLLAVVVAAVGVGASLLGATPLAVAVAVAQVLFVAGWFLVVNVPAREGGAALAILAGLAGDVAMLDRGSDVSLGPLAGVLGPALVLALVHQFARTDRGGRVTASLTATMTAVTLSVMAAALVGERHATHGETVTVVAIVAAGASAAVVAAPVPPAWAAWVDGIAVVSGLAAGVVAGAIAGDMDAGYVVGIALGAAVLAALGRRAATYVAYDIEAEAERARVAAAGAPVATGRAANRQARRQAAKQARHSSEAVLVMASALPLVLAAPAAYVLGRLLVG